MTVCPKYEKIMLLDVTGELDDKFRFSWQSHLKKCNACRREKETLSAMIARLKSASPAPPLSAADADTMVANINRQLAAGKNAGPRFPEWIQAFGKLIPAAAAVCLLFIVLGIFWQKNRAGQFVGHQAMNHPELVEAISPDEIEIIKNFEFLEEFESLEKLVQVIDHTEHNTPLTINPNNSQGSIFNEKDILYS